MYMIHRIRVRSHEVGLHFYDGEFVGLLTPDVHWFIDPLGRHRVDVVSQLAPFLDHASLDVIVASGVLKDRARVLDVKDDERALVWVDDRFERLVGPGLTVVFTNHRRVRVEMVHVDDLRFEHKDLDVILSNPSVLHQLETVDVPLQHVGLLYEDGAFTAELSSGRYAFWRKRGTYRVAIVSCREDTIDITGQELMTADKVTLRMNAVLFYRVTSPQRSFETASDVKQTLYRQAQLALRAIVGARDLDQLLAGGRDEVADEMTSLLAARAEDLGLVVVKLGIRDIVLPGEMKELLNRVTEAKKEAEANLIARREETAALRSQANTAKLLESSPVLMRLRELEVLEKVAENSKLSIYLGEEGLAKKVVNLL